MSLSAAAWRRTHMPAVMVGVLLTVTMIGVATLLLARDRRAAMDAVIAAQGNLALGLERDILRNIEIYDLSLRAAVSGMHVSDSAIDEAAQRTILFDGAPAARFFLAHLGCRPHSYAAGLLERAHTPDCEHRRPATF